MIAPGELSAAPDGGRYGEIYDRGYRHYEGERLGRRHAVGALIRFSIQRAMGIKKKWTAKIIPIILYTVAAGTVLILIGIEAFLPGASNDVLWTYADFFAFIFVIEGMFVAVTAPEMLCPDRRENVLALYFSRAITRLDYVLAKLAAMAILTLTLSFVPAGLLWLFRQLLDDKPLSALAANIDQLGRVAVVGALIAFYLGALGLVVSSFTGRKAIAIPVIIVGYVITEALVNSLRVALADYRWADYLYFLSPANATGNLAFKLFPGEHSTALPFAWWAYALAMAATIVLACGVMVWRYVPED